MRIEFCLSFLHTYTLFDNASYLRHKNLKWFSFTEYFARFVHGVNRLRDSSIMWQIWPWKRGKVSYEKSENVEKLVYYLALQMTDDSKCLPQSKLYKVFRTILQTSKRFSTWTQYASCYEASSGWTGKEQVLCYRSNLNIGDPREIALRKNKQIDFIFQK